MRKYLAGGGAKGIGTSPVEKEQTLLTQSIDQRTKFHASRRNLKINTESRLTQLSQCIENVEAGKKYRNRQ